MEAFKLSAHIDAGRKIMVDLPPSIPLGQVEMMIIVQPLTNGEVKSILRLAA